MNFPCPIKIDCPGTDFPVTNYSAEGAEATLPYIGVVWPPPVNPPAGSGFWATGCIGQCLSYTSQQEADECAQLQAALCDIGPNDGGGGGGGGTPYYSGEASCTVYCTDGTAFTYYVNAGLFVAWTQAEAQAIAQAYACEKAEELKVCLGDLQRCWCLGDNRTSTIVPSGGVVVAWVVVSGSLPPGLVFSNGVVSGIPTTGGTYSITVRGYLANGSYAQRTYVLTALNITQTTLPNGTEGANYDQQLTVTGGTAPYVFTLIGGGFPLGVDITTAGLITGVVGEVGVFNPVIQVTDATGCICSRTFSLTTDSSTPVVDFTFDLAPCSDGGSPFVYTAHSTYVGADSYLFQWKKAAVGIVDFDTATANSNKTVWGAINSDAACSIVHTILVGGVNYSIEKPVTVPHIDLPTNLHVVLTFLGTDYAFDLTLGFGVWSLGRWTGPAVTIPAFGDCDITIQQNLGEIADTLGTQLTLTAHMGAPIFSNSLATTKTGCRGNPVGSWTFQVGSFFELATIVVTAV